MAIIALLLGVSVSMFGRTAGTAQRSAMDQLMSSVDQARSAAITKRKYVVLAIAEPENDDVDRRCRLGLFTVDEEPKAGEAISSSAQLQRWVQLPDGVIFQSDKVRSLQNVLASEKTKLTWKDGKNSANVYVMAFNPRGGLILPEGSGSVALHLANGSYSDGKATATVKAGGTSAVRIGRVVARPWRIEP
jgi:Tfp pilus assembly protein FimT